MGWMGSSLFPHLSPINFSHYQLFPGRRCPCPSKVRANVLRVEANSVALPNQDLWQPGGVLFSRRSSGCDGGGGGGDFAKLSGAHRIFEKPNCGRGQILKSESVLR